MRGVAMNIFVPRAPGEAILLTVFYAFSVMDRIILICADRFIGF
jgi:hypothetical protein